MTPDELRQTRRAAGLTQAELARRVSKPGRSVSKARICDLEAGRVALSVDMTDRLRRALKRRPRPAVEAQHAPA